MKRFLYFILSAFVLVSCAREWEPEVALPEEGLVERTWTVAMSDGTRATLDDNLRPVWEAGEELSVYDHITGTGRIFKVVSVDGNQATISGQISEGGDTPFDAIYPAKSAGEWSSDGTNTLKLPEVQSIPAGRNICPDVLVSTAHSDSPDGVVAFHNISSLLKVQVGRDDIADISIDLKGSSNSVSSYKAAATSGTLAKGTYFIAVDPGTYSGGVTVVCSDGFGMEYHKSSTNALVAAAGGIKNLGTVSDGAPWRYYKVVDDSKSYSSALDLVNDTVLIGSITDFMTLLLVRMFVRSNFTDVQGEVSAIKYTYLSADPQGKPVELSAVLYLPEAATEGTDLAGITLANHGTIASNAECPSEVTQYEGAFAFKNHAVVMPDYYGFGISKDLPQAYLDAETTARGNIDAYLAALQLMADRNVEKPDKLFSFGYSQGGFNSMANLKYVSEHKGLGVTFDKVMCGGSPFDVELTWELYLDGEYRNAIGFVPMTLVSMNESQKLNIPYSHLFKDPLLSNWEAWILSKEKTLTELNDLLDTDDLADVLAAEMVGKTGQYYDTVIATARRYSLNSGWTSLPDSNTKILLYHSSNDDTVPSENLKAMTDYLDDNHVDYDSASAANGGHVSACVTYIQNIISEWK